MAALNLDQKNYLVRTLIPCAEELVSKIKDDNKLLQPLVDEQLTDKSICSAFLETLYKLPARITELLNQGKFVINDSLPHTQGALASTISPLRPTDVAIVQAVQVRSSLLDPNSIETIIWRVRTLIHEISHTIIVDNAFPIVDYSYVGGWAANHLGPLYAENADTYAEASMVVPDSLPLKSAEALPVTSKWLFRKYNVAIAQEAALRDAQAAGLSAALAWADLRVNRAWLRMYDFVLFANDVDDRSKDAPLHMRSIEEQFVKWGIVRARTKTWPFSSKWELNAAGQGAVKNVSGAVTQVKDWMTGMQVRVITDGDIDFTTDEPYKLHIPRAALSLPTDRLGSAILDKMFATLPDASNSLKTVTQTDLLNLCINNDRYPAQERLVDCWKALLETQPTPPIDPGALYVLDARLALAVVDARAVFWRNLSVKLAIPKFAGELGDAADAVGFFANTEQALEALKLAIGKISKAPNPLAAEIIGRGTSALKMIDLAIKTMADKAAVMPQADANKIKGWRDFSARVAAMKLTD